MNMPTSLKRFLFQKRPPNFSLFQSYLIFAKYPKTTARTTFPAMKKLASHPAALSSLWSSGRLTASDVMFNFSSPFLWLKLVCFAVIYWLEKTLRTQFYPTAYGKRIITGIPYVKTNNFRLPPSK